MVRQLPLISGDICTFIHLSSYSNGKSAAIDKKTIAALGSKNQNEPC
jgi:hypothetical protein